ncbi:MAG: Rieske (2Fe-2S) protein [Deltaproteobacteria bacterium]|nr:Rieske (2Fe-2S) protein [Deltaproteobacteria bacterium]
MSDSSGKRERVEGDGSGDLRLDPALRSEELWEGELRGLRIAGRRIVVLRVEGGAMGYEDRCAHLGLPISEGAIDGATLTCAAHGWTYCAKTGRGINPARAALAPVRVEEREGWIWVDVGK